MKILQKYCLYALSFCMAAVMMLVPIRAEAEANHTLLATGQFYNTSEHFTLDFIYYNSTGEWSSSSEVVSSGFYTTADGWYQVFHVKHQFGSIAYCSSLSGYDSFYYDFSDASRFVSYYENDPGIDNGYVQNIEVYLSAFSGGKEYKMHLNQSQIYANEIVMGEISVYPVVEFDVVLYLDSSVSSDSNSYRVVFDFGGSENPFNVYGVNYSTSGEDQIIDGILDNTTAVNDAKSGIVAAVNDAASYIGNQIMYYIQLLETSVNTQFSQLFNNMQAWYNGLTKTINNGIDRLVNNYQGSETTEAESKFNTGADELTSIEGNLSDSSNSYVNDFTTTGFDASILTTIGSSMTFVVTWFTNFWNMGGVLTSGLNICFAIAIAFFILRVKR